MLTPGVPTISRAFRTPTRSSISTMLTSVPSGSLGHTFAPMKSTACAASAAVSTCGKHTASTPAAIPWRTRSRAAATPSRMGGIRSITGCVPAAPAPSRMARM